MGGAEYYQSSSVETVGRELEILPHVGGRQHSRQPEGGASATRPVLAHLCYAAVVSGQPAEPLRLGAATGGGAAGTLALQALHGDGLMHQLVSAQLLDRETTYFHPRQHDAAMAAWRLRGACAARAARPGAGPASGGRGPGGHARQVGPLLAQPAGAGPRRLAVFQSVIVKGVLQSRLSEMVGRWSHCFFLLHHLAPK